MDRLRPPRPALTFGEKGLALTHTPPTYASHVALYLYDADGKKRFLDADKNELLAPGETGGALSVQGGHRQDVYYSSCCSHLVPSLRTEGSRAGDERLGRARHKNRARQN